MTEQQDAEQQPWTFGQVGCVLWLAVAGVFIVIGLIRWGWDELFGPDPVSIHNAHELVIEHYQDCLERGGATVIGRARATPMPRAAGWGDGAWRVTLESGEMFVVGGDVGRKPKPIGDAAAIAMAKGGCV